MTEMLTNATMATYCNINVSNKYVLYLKLTQYVNYMSIKNAYRMEYNTVREQTNYNCVPQHG